MIDDPAAANSYADPAQANAKGADQQPAGSAATTAPESWAASSGGGLMPDISDESQESKDTVSDEWRQNPIWSFFDRLEEKGVSRDLVQRDAWNALRGWFLGRIETAKALIADRALHDANRKHDFLTTVAEVVAAAKSAIANNHAPEALLADLKLMDDSDLAWFAVVILKGQR